MPKIYSSKKASEFSKNDRTLNVRQYEEESKELLANLKEFELHHTVVEQLDENDHAVRIIFDLAGAIHPVTHEPVTIHEITNDNLFSVYFQKALTPMIKLLKYQLLNLNTINKKHGIHFIKC